MRVCLVSNQQSEHIQRLSRYLVARNHEVHLVSARNQSVQLPDVVFHYLSNSKIFWPLQVKQLIQNINPDVVDGHFANVYGFLAAISGFHPLVVTVWGSDIFIHPWENPLWKFTTKYALNKADVINCLFEMSVANPALIKLKVDLGKVRTTLLGVDTGNFKPMGFDAGLAKEIGVFPNTPVIINVRGFAPIYDFKTYFKAIPLVLKEIPTAKFLAFYKKGELSSGEQIASESGITESVRFIEWQPRSKMPSLLSLANIYVSTSLSDGASNALFEAMACGLVPVVTDIAANRPWVKEGVNGFLFERGNSAKLAEIIINLLKSKTTLMQFGARCRQIVQAKAEQKDELQKIENVYQKLIER